LRLERLERHAVLEPLSRSRSRYEFTFGPTCAEEVERTCPSAMASSSQGRAGVPSGRDIVSIESAARQELARQATVSS
jgi:hypothetical protein